MFSPKSHSHSLLPRLQAYGVEISEAVHEGRYIALDAAEAPPTFIIDGTVDSSRFLEASFRMREWRRGGNIPVLQSLEKVPIYSLPRQCGSRDAG